MPHAMSAQQQRVPGLSPSSERAHLQVQLPPVKADGLHCSPRIQQNGPPGRLIDPPRLHAHKAALYDVYPANAIVSCHLHRGSLPQNLPSPRATPSISSSAVTLFERLEQQQMPAEHTNAAAIWRTLQAALQGADADKASMLRCQDIRVCHHAQLSQQYGRAWLFLMHGCTLATL